MKQQHVSGDERQNFVMCRFSGDWIDANSAEKMAIYLPNSDEIKIVFSKPRELVKRLAPGFPIHPDIIDLANS